MRSADGDENAGLTDIKMTEAVEDGDAVYGVLIVDLRADFAHFGERHGLVGLVFEVTGPATMRFVANESIERDEGAVPIRTDVPDGSVRVDRTTEQFAPVHFR